MTQQTPYIGSKISLISKLDIRYEGILYTVDSKESTIALSKVRSFGTEDRNAAHVVPPQDDVYDYIIFKANDIKDLIVCETPKPPAPGLPYDPAIISVSQGEKPPAPVGSERSVSATRSSTPRSNNPLPSSQQQSQPPQQQQNWKNNDNKNNSNNYRQGNNYQNRNNHQNRQYDNNRTHGYDNNRQHGYDNNRQHGYNNYRQHGYDNNRDNSRQHGYDNRQDKQQNRNYQPQNRNNYNNSNSNNRGGNNQNRGNNRPHGGPRNNLKFDSDYDFEKAYEQFKETLESIVGEVQNITINDSHDDDAGSVKSGEGNEIFYDKNKSFFDSISCEALEKEEGKNTRPDWRKERLTNQETFGQQSVRSYGYRHGGYSRGGNNNGYRGGRGGGNNQNRGNGNNYNNNQRRQGPRV